MARVLLSRTLWAAVEEAGVNPARSRHCHRGASLVSRRRARLGHRRARREGRGERRSGSQETPAAPSLQRRSAVTPEEARRTDMNHDGQALTQAENNGFYQVADVGFRAETLAAIQPPDAAAERAAR